MKEYAAPSRSFLCLRHGVTDWNRQGRFQGRTDIPLNDEGIAQARAAALRLQTVAFDHIVSSPLIRAVKTADIVAEASCKPVLVDADLIECDFGSLEGKSIRETMQEHGITAMEDLATILPADGEAWAHVSERALRCVGRWLDRHLQADILFVCHDAVMQSMSQALCRCWFDNRHGVPFRFNRIGNDWTVDEV
ncbi:MAG TPA: histidine phosphatase family protein [Bradyrhizobium sp.]|uniref:histidine phosphatase family protein n=1 Tax=Bradyrhizobium sp. TaxID=376 RepID=UPI002C134ECE|nr:histidine phosphatase family protein [Bradyrhizobium sp.]HTB04631.1 histidine phosphatase family protein [Bradyrhizobium sp.]